MEKVIYVTLKTVEAPETEHKSFYVNGFVVPMSFYDSVKALRLSSLVSSTSSTVKGECSGDLVVKTSTIEVYEKQFTELLESVKNNRG